MPLALRPGGIFVNADTCVAETPSLRDRAFRLWAESMRPHGIDEKEAYDHVANWALEDFYPSLSVEHVAVAAPLTSPAVPRFR